MEVWVKPLQGGDWAVMFLNRSGDVQNVHFKWKDHEVKDEIFDRSMNLAALNYDIQDLWKGKKVGNTQKAFKSEVPGHDVVMLRLSPQSKKLSRK
jgi:alpha-galactosidase